uniref:Vasoactive intestinal polypeptide receptor 1 n=1 Tax=Chelonoidis abingdonii TaxID=106734 RepID=A0A8C0JAC5_CHEAB
ECKIFQQVVKDQALCLEKNEATLPNLKGKRHRLFFFPGCPGDWDGLSCWPKATFGEVVKVACPGFFEEITNIQGKNILGDLGCFLSVLNNMGHLLMCFTVSGFLQRNCTQEAYWSEPYPPYSIACGFDEGSSKGPEDQKSYYSAFWHVYTAGYATSLTSLITALVIFAIFRKFHCTRNYIHMHLFVSFILRATAVFIKDAVLFADENMDHCLMSTVACKVAVAFFQFSILANFFWLLVEGMYLQTLLLLTFVSDKQYYTLMFSPIVCICAFLQLCLEKLRNPFFSLQINFIIFVNVIRILVQKLQSPEVSGSQFSHFVRLAKSTLLLIPLFGVHYIVFAFCPESTGLDARLYIELGLGSFQGFVVALLYCFLNGEVQAELKKRLRKWQYQEYLSFTRKPRCMSRENSPVNYVTQLSLLEKISPQRKTSLYRNGTSSA